MLHFGQFDRGAETMNSSSAHARLPRVALSLFALVLAACQPDTGGSGGEPSPSDVGRAPAGTQSFLSDGVPIEHSLVPLPGRDDTAPVLTRSVRVLLETTAGDVIIEVYPEAAPNAAERFVTLIESGYYDATPVSRVVPGFVAQFGINWRAAHRSWRDRPFDDDPTFFALDPGTLAFAKAGPNTNSTQVFINLAQNNRLATPQYGSFTVFGKVVDGLDVVERFVQVGDPSGGLDQGRLWADGDAYLESLETKPTMITRAVVL